MAKVNASIARALCAVLVLGLGSSAVPSSAQVDTTSKTKRAAISAEETAFAAAVDRYFEKTFEFSPEWATALGFHEYDARLHDDSPERIKARINELKAFQRQFENIDAKNLTARSRMDKDLITAHISASLLHLEHERPFEKNPDHYSSSASSAIYSLMTRDFLPLEQRLRSVVAREHEIPHQLQQARANLKNPPKIYTEIALEQLPGIIAFFRDSVPETFKGVQDKKLSEEFRHTNEKTIAALKDYEVYLKETVLPRSKGDFALGADAYGKKLLYEEMVDIPLDKLLASGEAELRRLQTQFIETAGQIDPAADPRQVFEAVSKDHPAPDKLIPSVSGVLKQLKDMCVEKNLVTIPADDELKVEETPPFMRALAFAAMDTPGTFERKKLDSYYYVTLPGKDWKAERTEEHMRSFCKYDLLNTSVHEAYPGHFVQGLWDRKAPSKTAKILSCGSNVEGWAHYCEEMMVDEGLENHDKKLRLAQIHDALLRACRFIAGIKMHTQGMTLEQACELFEKEGYQEKANALREAKRGTMDPTYLVYTLGKLQIMSLRDDYKQAQGSNFKLKDFHDQFLAQGPAPVKMIRKVIIGDRGSQTAESN